MAEDEKLDVDEAVAKLNAALALQHRSVLEWTLAGGSLTGFDFMGFAEQLAGFGAAETEDTRRLVEKIIALGGEPTTEIADLEWAANPEKMFDIVRDHETEAIEAFQASIEPTGREGRSEALEHRLEHIIMRKQEQLELLERARR